MVKFTLVNLIQLNSISQDHPFILCL